jgi:nitroimidazol reductase NimA-like FMN-containing flavoprotein (pyridoxamine 5'-phosphate oxidase superfamily)
MLPLTTDRIEELLEGPHQAVLSVSRNDRGPVAVPMSYRFVDGRFVIVTSPTSLHGRLMARTGRATITVQFEDCDGRSTHQWYVMAEGPIEFTDEDPTPHVYAIMAKDRGAENADAWTAGPPPSEVEVAVLTPSRISGYEYRDALD